MRFLVLMNGGVVQSVIESNEEANVEVKIAGLVAKYSAESLQDVGQAVLNTLAREHQNAFINGSLQPRSSKRRRDLDMLVIRLSQIHADSIERPIAHAVSEATLEHDFKEDVDGSIKEEAKSVHSYVDFSYLSTHPLGEQVLRNIEEIKKRYKKVSSPQLNEADEEDIQL
uniref:Ribosome-binding factor A n=1 Tax=Syphacia muris TaxID=451379 RepID=A0A0N5AM48_9BILA